MAIGQRPDGLSAWPPPALIVVNYKSHQLLARNLPPSGAAGEVFVVDNWSDALERAAVRALALERGWQLATPADNLGFGSGVNLAAAMAIERGARELILVNPDAQVPAHALAVLAEHVHSRPDDLVAPTIVDSSGEVVFAGSEIVLPTGELRRPRPGGPTTGVQPWLTGAVLAISSTLFTRLGGFAPDYFLYWEDVELSYRAVALGATLVVREDVQVVHDEGGTHGNTSGPAKSSLYYRWNARNRLLFATRNLPTGVLLRWLWHTPAQSWAIVLRGGRRQLVHSPAPLIAIVRGSAAGVGLVVRELLRRATLRVVGGSHATVRR